jgi:DNA-directed RNA polymerase subunit RPC12/RpoP
MFKNIIAPVQAWLISQGRCVGCGTPLKDGKKLGINKEEDQITCQKCGRIFIFNKIAKRYQRAPLPASSSLGRPVSS